jgi:cell division protein FtsW
MRFAWWQALAWIGFGATALLQLVVVLGAGSSRGGNTNWLEIGQFTIQPSEFLKVGLALWLGTVLAIKKDKLGSWLELAVPALLGVAVGVGIVLLGHDAGTATVIALFAAGTLVVAGVPWRRLLVIGVLLGGVGTLAVMADEGRRGRVQALFDTSLGTISTDSWQTGQAAYALAEGGLFGRGLGASREKWAWLSQADSDFIFAIIGEELGLVGCLIVLVLFAVLIIGLFQVVRLHPDRFAQITVGAIACWLSAQAIINIGMVLQVLPVIGVPLPFVSSGGSALLASMAAIGCVLGLMRGDPEVGSVLRSGPQIRKRAFGLVQTRPGDGVRPGAVVPAGRRPGREGN